MNRRMQMLCAALCGFGLLGALAGCEDSEARQRADVQQQIADARVQFQKASLGSTAPDDEHVQQVRGELNGIVNSLTPVTGGAPGQQAAKSLLIAEALRELAMIDIRRIGDLEHEHHVDRRTIDNRLHGIRRLAVIRAAREAVSTDDYRSALAEARSASQQQLRAVQDELAQLRGPIEELSARNEQERARVDELREQARELYRQANEQGHADGFSTFEEAIAVQREADLIEYRIAHRELELVLERQPEHDLRSNQAERLQFLLESLQSGIRDLEQFDEVYSSAAANLRDRIDEGRAAIRQAVQRISSSMKGDLAARYDDAADFLERAVSQARQAVSGLRGEEASAARLIEARTQEALGRLHAQRAGGIADHMALLASLANSEDAIGDTQPYRAEHSQFAQQHDSLRNEAREAIEAAKESLTLVTGSAAQDANRYRQSLDMLLGAMAGEAVDMTQRDQPQPARDSGTGSSGSAPAPTASGGFATAEALVEFLRTMDETDPAVVAQWTNLIHVESRIGRAMKGMLQSVGTATAELAQAMEDQFGAAAVEAMRQNMGAMGGTTSFANIAIVEQSETNATARYAPMPGMPEQTIELINRGGQWVIDGDSMATSQMGGQEVDDAAAGMVEQMSQMISAQIRQLTQRVRNGEFSSIEQVQQELMQMTQGAGGMP